MFFGAALLADGVLPGGQDFGAGAGRLEADGERLPVFGVRLSRETLLATLAIGH